MARIVHKAKEPHRDKQSNIQRFFENIPLDTILSKTIPNLYQRHKKLIKWLSFAAFFVMFIWMYYESLRTVAAVVSNNYESAKGHDELSYTLAAYCFIFLCLFYANYTNHLILLLSIVTVFFVYDRPYGAGLFFFLMFLEILECKIYKRIVSITTRASNQGKKVKLLVIQYIFKAIGITYILTIALMTVSLILTDYLKSCGWVPFPKVFSSFGYFSCGDKINLTLKPNQNNENQVIPEIKFTIPYEYLSPNQKVGKVNEITIFAAYPNFEPWFKAQREHPALINSDPVEITIKSGGGFILSSSYEQSKIFLGERFQMKEYTHKGLSDWEMKYHTSYYEPLDKKWPIYFAHCATTEYHYTSKCGFSTIYSPNLGGSYKFIHGDIAHWQEIDISIRKLVASFVQSPHVEKFYLIDEVDFYDEKGNKINK